MNRTWLTLPNGLSLLRVAVLPLAVQALAGRDHALLLVAVVVILLSDFFDGALARWLGQVSDIGKMLDPVADKICTAVLSIALVVYTDLPPWVMVLLVVKDLLIALGGWWISRREKIPITPNFWGKAAAFSQLVLFSVYAFDLAPLQHDAVWVTTGFVLVSALLYFWIFVAVWRGRRSIREIVSGYSAYGLNRGPAKAGRNVNLFIYLLCAAIGLRLGWLLWTHYLR